MSIISHDCGSYLNSVSAISHSHGYCLNPTSVLEHDSSAVQHDRICSRQVNYSTVKECNGNSDRAKAKGEKTRPVRYFRFSERLTD